MIAYLVAVHVELFYCRHLLPQQVRYVEIMQEQKKRIPNNT